MPIKFFCSTKFCSEAITLYVERDGLALCCEDDYYNCILSPERARALGRALLAAYSGSCVLCVHYLKCECKGAPNGKACGLQRRPDEQLPYPR